MLCQSMRKQMSRPQSTGRASRKTAFIKSDDIYNLYAYIVVKKVVFSYNLTMRCLFILIFISVSSGLFAQANNAAGAAASIAPGAQARVHELLNKPEMVSPVAAVPLGKNWFRVVTDAHMFSDEVSVPQVSAIFTDFVNQEKNFTGKKSILAASVVSTGQGGTIVDFMSTAITPLGVKIKTSYRDAVTVYENTETKASIGIRQIDSDNASNNMIKGMYTIRYAEAVTIDGKAYTYVRLYIIDDVNGNIIPNAKRALESQSGPAILEAIELIVNAAKSK